MTIGQKLALASLGLALILLAIPARAQTLNLSESSPYTAARIGINVGYQDYYQDYLLKNWTATINPGFQPPIYAQTIPVVSGNTTSFTGGDPFDQVTANWWSTHGGTFYVIYGSNAGCTGTITANTVAGGNGPTYTISPACSNAFAQFDVVNIKAPATATTADLGWTISTSSSTVTADTTSGDLPTLDGFSPFQVMKIVNSGGGSSASFSMNFDTTSGNLYYNATGTITQSLMIDVISGSPTFNFAASRPGGLSCSNNVSPSGGWNTYSTTCAASEPTTLTPNAITITYTMSGTGTALIVASSISSSVDSNASAFRNQVTNDFDSMNVGECRFWEQQNGISLLDWITPQGFRSPAEGSGGVDYPTAIFNGTFQTGLHDDLVMAAAHCGGQVWIEVPLPFNPTDLQNLADYLGGGSGTTYGAKRIALGQTTPWTSVFSRIVLEYGNEPWNGAAQTQNIPYGGGGSTGWSYIPMVVSACTTLKASASWAASEKCAGGFQTGSAFYASQLETYDTGHKVDIQANNEYGGYTMTTVTAPAPQVSASTEAWGAANDLVNNMFGVTFNQAPLTGQYEWQHGDVASGTTFTQSTINGFGEGEGYAAMVDAIAPLWVGQKFGALDHDFFTYSEPNFTGPSGLQENLWGIKTGVGGAYNNPRPAYYAAEIDDNCIGSTGIGWPVSGSSIPTYNFTAKNGVPAESNVPYIQAFEFKPTSSSRCVLIANVDPTNPHTFNVSGTNAPSGTVTIVTLTASSMTTTNEGANGAINVQPATTTVSNPSSFTLAAHSMESVTWNVSSGISAPVLVNGKVSLSGGIKINP